MRSPTRECHSVQGEELNGVVTFRGRATLGSKNASRDDARMADIALEGTGFRLRTNLGTKFSFRFSNQPPQERPLRYNRRIQEMARTFMLPAHFLLLPCWASTQKYASKRPRPNPSNDAYS